MSGTTRRFAALRTALVHGAEAAWPEIEEAALARDELMWIAQGLDVTSDSLWLRARAK